MQWLGAEASGPDWSDESRLLAYSLRCGPSTSRQRSSNPYPSLRDNEIPPIPIPLIMGQLKALHPDSSHADLVSHGQERFEWTRHCGRACSDGQCRTAIYIAFNTSHLSKTVSLPDPGSGGQWRLLVDTSMPEPYDALVADIGFNLSKVRRAPGRIRFQPEQVEARMWGRP